jgi:hypothetical protein
VAVTALVLIAGTLAGVGIARSGGSPAKPQLTLVTPYPAAVAADATLADRTGGTAPLLASLTGIASAGKTVVAIGTAPSQPAPVPLLLVSADGGRTWTRATVSGAGTGVGTGPGPGAAAGAGLASGTVPVLIARGGGAWLALGQRAAWTSPDGKTWRPAPGLPPVAGDTVLGLAGTGSGFVAVGEHTGSQPGPVVWTSSAGRPWLRWTGTARGLAAHGGHVTALRWAAAQGGVVVAGGPIAGAPGAGRRPDAGVWRSTDGGLHWTQVTLPASHGATDGLAGLAANGTTFAAVRPGHAAGHQDAVTYLSSQGSTWRYAGKLTPVRRASLQVTAVSGSSHGFVVGALVHASQVAFISARGHGWQQTADPGTGMTSLTAGSGGTVLVAGDSRPGAGGAGLRPHLLLIGPGTGRQQVGQATLAAAATPDVTVNGLASGDRTLVAAGSAGGSPALWLASAGQWARAGVLLPAAWRDGELLSVTHGGEGWLAVGRAGSPARSAQAPAPAQPVILTSATGTSWAPASGTAPLIAPGTSLAQAAAGPAGYVVVGSVPASGGPARGAPVPAAWYSAGLGRWARAPLPAPGPGEPGGSSQVVAVTAARSGFVAVGAAGRLPAVWTSQSGSAWRFAALPRPAGATGAVLTKVTAAGGRVIAAGYELRSGPAPTGGSLFTAVSADGGRTWHESALPAPPGPAAVTALTAAGHGFVAVGRDGPPGRQRMLAWSSSAGLTWNDAAPAAGGPGRPFVIQINALTAAGGTLTGAGFAVSATAEHPVLWHARYR